MIFLWIIGPPAVGKMAVARRITEKTGFKILHNHGTIELILPIFPWGHPKFRKLSGEFRLRIFEEVATSELPGFLFTYVTDYSDSKERAYMEKITKIFKDQGHDVYYVELYAELSIRLQRNIHPERLDAKPSKRNIKKSEQHLLNWEKEYPHMVSSDEYPFFFPENYLKIENSHLSLNEVAELVIKEFKLIKED